MRFLARPLLASLLSLAALAACSSSSNGGGGSAAVTAVGTLSGQSLAAAGGLVFTGPATSSASAGTGLPDGGIVTTSGSALTIGILDNAAVGSCSFVESLGNNNVANLAALTLVVATATGSSVPVGTYDVGASGDLAAGATYQTSNATCATSTPVDATSGTVTLSAVSSSSVTGSYDVTFGTAGSFKGTFDVPVCSVPTLDSDGPKGCKQP